MFENRSTLKHSRRNSGKIGPACVKWMTAGAGIIHFEMPDREFIRMGDYYMHFSYGLTPHDVMK